MSKKDIQELVFGLYKEVTPKGKDILDELVDTLVFNLDVIRQTIDLEKEDK